ncbi:metallophosphoesterase [Mitsuokella sp. WILCCON 0060]|uniref:metallophosphoesterase n=1 Tax=Mitsuokella sp. WILCCON 0060 TaxID=3345341 RepID=UPI003F1AA36A
MIYLITDTHLGHKNMIQSCNRPENFTNQILKNCQKMIGKDDLLIHLGDVAWYQEVMQRFLKLPGRKILIRGNHDKKSTAHYMQAGFMLVVDEMTMTLNGMKVLFSHAPVYGHSADINIHGHQHDLHYEDQFYRYWPLSLEHMGYKPIALDDEVLSTLRCWVDRKRNPNIHELMALRQDYLGKASARDYMGNIRASMLKPLQIYLSDGTEIVLRQDDIVSFHRHEGCIFLAIPQNLYHEKLSRYPLEAIQVPEKEPQADLLYLIQKTLTYTMMPEEICMPQRIQLLWLKTSSA